MGKIKTGMLNSPISSANELSQFSDYCSNPYRKKLYRGVRQRYWGKWVAEIKLPHNRMWVWLGMYERSEAAAYAYVQAAYNFPNIEDPSQLGLIGDAQRLNALKNVVDSKIQAICQKVRREKANWKKNKSKKSEGESVGCDEEREKVMKAECSSSISCVGNEVMSSPSMSKDEFWKGKGSHCSASGESKVVAGAATSESEFEGCSLARLPFYDQELIWEVLAN